ncbi:MAG: signal peptidase I [Bacteroidota bacterium]
MSVKNKKSAPKRPGYRSSSLKDWINAFLVALVLLVLFRFFVYDITSISNSSMQATLLAGDILLVNKYNYGARMPLRIVPQFIVNAFFTTDSIALIKQLPYWRFVSNRDFQHQDLILFNTPVQHFRPIDQRPKQISRLVGLPGEQIEIHKSRLYVDGKKFDEPATVQRNYEVFAKDPDLIKSLIRLFAIREGGRIKKTNRFVFPFTQSKVDSIKSFKGIKTVKPYLADSSDGLPIVMGEKSEKWTADDFGPVVVPYKGMKINLDGKKTDKYLYHLLHHERRKFIFRNDSVFLDGMYVKEYEFKMDYYFVLGDNRHNTSDSRMWGFVPENHILGRISAIVLSVNKMAKLSGKIRWDRLLRPVGET